MPYDALIAPARTAVDLAAVVLLFQAYEASLDVDLGYQDFASELASLPGEYAPPSGALLLAENAKGEPVGCVALRSMDKPGRCEMKRLYVSPAGRGLGLARRLIQALIGEAKRIGYDEMWLDTLPTMLAAQSLYRTAGFKPTDPYYETPISGTVFLRLKLGNWCPRD